MDEISYPKWKYSPQFHPQLVTCEDEEISLGSNWFDTPADFGLESCPGVRPNKEIAKKKNKVSDNTGK